MNQWLSERQDEPEPPESLTTIQSGSSLTNVRRKAWSHVTLRILVQLCSSYLQQGETPTPKECERIRQQIPSLENRHYNCIYIKLRQLLKNDMWKSYLVGP